MTTVTFDTLELTRRLETAGVPREQAIAIVQAIAEAQDRLATKADITAALAPLERKLVEHDGEFKLIKWMLGLLLGGVLSLLLKAFF